MGEAACVLHSFTFPSYGETQGNGLEALQESVSFGRFATEALAWDKWSSFTNKRYVEEAAKHSQPGLVAKKKAFFEAYYKKKALLEQEQEQENTADANCPQEFETEKDNNIHTCSQSLERMASDLQAKDGGKDDMEASGTEANIFCEDSEKPSIQICEDVSGMKQFASTEKNAAILRDLKTSQEDSDTTVGKILPASPQPPPPLPRALLKKSSSRIGPRVSFACSTEDISFRSPEKGTFRELPVPDVPSTEELTASKMPADSLESESKRTEKLLNTPASRSRKSRTDDMLLFSESSKTWIKSNSPVISSPFVFGRGKGTDEKREKLKEILNGKPSNRVQFQTKIKNKAASQLKKLRLSFCFTCRASPDLQMETMKNQEKPAMLDDAQISSMKIGCWRLVEKQRSHRKIRPGSLGEVIAQKGKSPIAQCF